MLYADLCAYSDVLRTERDAGIAGLAGAGGRTWFEPNLMDLADVEVPAGGEVYLCGGTGFLRAIRDQLAAAGVDRGHVHFELFGPNDWPLDR